MTIDASNGSHASEGLIDQKVLATLAPTIRNVAHPLRLRILDYLRHEGEPRTVSQIINVCGAEQAIVSQQLRILKDLGILTSQRRGTFILYSIADASALFLLDCIRDHARHIG